MIPIDDFLYCLRDDQGQFWYYDGGFNSTGTPTPLVSTPSGWKDIAIERQRSTMYGALERSFTLALDFYSDGSKIINYFYYTYGTKAKLSLCILELRKFIDSTHYSFWYSLLYSGELDFTQFNHAGPKVTLNVMEGGAAKLLKSFEDTKYPINLSDRTTRINWEGIRYVQKSFFSINNGFLQTDVGGHIIQADFVSEEAYSSIGSKNEERVKVGNSINTLWQADSYILKTGSEPTEATFTWDFSLTPSLTAVGAVYGTRLDFQLHLLQSETERTDRIILGSAGGTDPLSLYNHKQRFTGSATVVIPGNSTAILYMTSTQNRDLTTFTYDSDGTLGITYTYRKAATFVTSKRAYIVFEELAQQIGIKYTTSKTLDTKFRQLVFTCGNAIRGLENPSLQISMLDFFKTIRAVCQEVMLGVNADNTGLVLEGLDYFCSDVPVIDLGEVVDLEVSNYVAGQYNVIKYGFPNQNYNDVNGKQEFNTTSTWTTEQTGVKNEYNRVSPSRGDGFGMERLRINLEGKTTTDNGSDNDNFVIWLEKYKDNSSPLFDSFKLDRSLNQYASGLLQPETVFNLYFSPLRMLYRGSDAIHSSFYMMDDTVLKYQTADKNEKLIVNEPGVILLKENDDVAISDLYPQIWTPNLMKFTLAVPFEVRELLRLNGRRIYRFIYDGHTYYGIPFKDSIEPASGKPQSFTVLSEARNDLKKLIFFNGR